MASVVWPPFPALTPSSPLLSFPRQPFRAPDCPWAHQAYPFRISYSPDTCVAGFYTSFRSLLGCHFLREVFLHPLLNITTSSSQHSLFLLYFSPQHLILREIVDFLDLIVRHVSLPRRRHSLWEQGLALFYAESPAEEWMLLWRVV